MCWLTDVIIPIICALIGGGLTMWGVQQTLKAQRIESDHIRIQEAKPYLFMEHPMQAPAWDSIPHVALKSAEGDSGDYELQCYVKSSDNGIAIIKNVTTDNHMICWFDGDSMNMALREMTTVKKLCSLRKWPVMINQNRLKRIFPISDTMCRNSFFRLKHNTILRYFQTRN